MRTAGSWNAPGGSPQRACFCQQLRPTLLCSAAYTSVPAYSGLTHTKHIYKGKWSPNPQLSYKISFAQKPKDVLSHLSWSETGQRCTPCSCIRRSRRLPRTALCTPYRQWSTHVRPLRNVRPPARMSRRCNNSSPAGIQSEESASGHPVRWLMVTITEGML